MDRFDRLFSARTSTPKMALRGALLCGALLVGGCQIGTALNSEASTKKTVSQKAAEQQLATAPKPAFSEFTDVPIPSDSEMNLEETIILGAEEGWIGRLSIDTGHGLSEMYTFYDTEMPKFGWTRVTVVRSEISTLTFSRAGRIATITLQPAGFSTTGIDFIVSPERQSARSG